VIFDPDEIEDVQRAICRQHAVKFVAAPADSKSGVAISTRGRLPINGLRHPVVGDTNGWYIWFGERFSNDPEFFVPIHARHFYEQEPEVGRLLGLAPGYRFLLEADYLDIWYDATLLEV